MLHPDETIIPKGTIPENMPAGLQVLYTSDAFGNGGELLTEERLADILQQIRGGEGIDVYFWKDADMEQNLLFIENDSYWISIVYFGDDDSFYTCFDPDYLDSDEEAPVIAGDGQSIILKRETMHDPLLAAECIEYCVRTGTLYPGMEWLKVE